MTPAERAEKERLRNVAEAQAFELDEPIAPDVQSEGGTQEKQEPGLLVRYDRFGNPITAPRVRYDRNGNVIQPAKPASPISRVGGVDFATHAPPLTPATMRADLDTAPAAQPDFRLADPMALRREEQDRGGLAFAGEALNALGGERQPIFGGPNQLPSTSLGLNQDIEADPNAALAGGFVGGAPAGAALGAVFPGGGIVPGIELGPEATRFFPTAGHTSLVGRVLRRLGRVALGSGSNAVFGAANAEPGHRGEGALTGALFGAAGHAVPETLGAVHDNAIRANGGSAATRNLADMLRLRAAGLPTADVREISAPGNMGQEPLMVPATRPETSGIRGNPLEWLINDEMQGALRRAKETGGRGEVSPDSVMNDGVIDRMLDRIIGPRQLSYPEAEHAYDLRHGDTEPRFVQRTETPRRTRLAEMADEFRAVDLPHNDFQRLHEANLLAEQAGAEMARHEDATGAARAEEARLEAERNLEGRRERSAEAVANAETEAAYAPEEEPGVVSEAQRRADARYEAARSAQERLAEEVVPPQRHTLIEGGDLRNEIGRHHAVAAIRRTNQVRPVAELERAQNIAEGRDVAQGPVRDSQGQLRRHRGLTPEQYRTARNDLRLRGRLGAGQLGMDAPKQEAARAVRAALVRLADRAIEVQNPEGAEPYRAARRRYGAMEAVQEGAHNEAIRGAVNRQIPLTDYLAAIAGSVRGGIMGGIGAALTNEAFRGSEHAAHARYAESLIGMHNAPGGTGAPVGLGAAYGPARMGQDMVRTLLSPMSQRSGLRATLGDFSRHRAHPAAPQSVATAAQHFLNMHLQSDYRRRVLGQDDE